MLTEGLKHSFHAQEIYQLEPSVNSFGQGQPPANVRRAGERHKIIRQTDSGLWVDARAGPGGLSNPEALLIRTLPHDLVMGRMAQGVPRALHDLVMGGLSRAGSRQIRTTRKIISGSFLLFICLASFISLCLCCTGMKS